MQNTNSSDNNTIIFKFVRVVLAYALVVVIVSKTFQYFDLHPRFALFITLGGPVALATWYITTVMTRDFNACFGGTGVLEILLRNPRGMTIQEILLWRAENWEQNVDLFPNMPRDAAVYPPLLKELCDAGLVRAEREGESCRFFLTCIRVERRQEKEY